MQVFVRWLETAPGRNYLREARELLIGKNLACWCKIGSPCHGEPLLSLINFGGVAPDQ